MCKPTICDYCKREYPKSEFKIKDTKQYSSYFITCRDIAETKSKNDEIPEIRDLNFKEVNLQKAFIKKMRVKEKKEKLIITKGVI